jgi:hypothetical protein
MLVWVREWGVHLRLMNMGMMSICVPGQCERSAFARGVFFSSMVMGVLKAILRAIFPFPYLNLTNT